MAMNEVGTSAAAGSNVDIYQDNDNAFVAFTSIPEILTRVETLFGLIDQDFVVSLDANITNADEQVEKWAQEIHDLSERMSYLPVRSIADLKAKVSLSLLILEQSHFDPVSFKEQSEKVLKCIDALDPQALTKAP